MKKTDFSSALHWHMNARFFLSFQAYATAHEYSGNSCSSPGCMIGILKSTKITELKLI